MQFDLERLAWVELEVPSIKTVRLPLFGDEFTQFTQDQIDADPPEFVRKLLASLAQSVPSHETVEVEATNQLSAADLDTVAASIIAKSGRYFQVRHEITGGNKAKRVRRLQDDELRSVEAVTGEDASARLIRILRAWLSDQQNSAAFEEQRMRPTIDRMQRNASTFTKIEKTHSYVDQIKALQDPSGILATARLAHGTLYNHQSPMMESIRAIFESPTGMLLAAARSQSAAANALRINDSLGIFEARGMLGEYPWILSAAARAAEIAQATAGLSAASNVSVGILADQIIFAQAISRQYDLGINSKILKTIQAFQEGAAIAGASRSMFPPGFQLAAATGLENARVRGLTADVLKNYGDPAEGTPIFAMAMQSTSLADTEDFAPAKSVDFLSIAAARLMDLAKGERDPVRLNAILTFLTFILTLVSAVASEGSLRIAREQLEFDKASQASDHKDFKEILGSAQAAQADMEASRRELAARDRHLRYVHERAPLRLEPHREAPTIRFVYSDQVLRALEEQGDWLKVEVYDYQSEALTTGWISRRHVRIQPLD